jgi:hypothetical protein
MYATFHCAFRIEFLLGPCALLALVLNHEFSTMEILWTFSIYLESVAILPQVEGSSSGISVSDPHHFDADPDPACHFYPDPDHLTFSFLGFLAIPYMLLFLSGLSLALVSL